MRLGLSRLLAVLVSSFVFLACGEPVEPEGVSPTLALMDEPHFRVGEPGVLRVTVTGEPAPALTLSGDLPTGLAFGAEAKVISGTPAAGTGGQWPLTLRASNGIGSGATLEVFLRVDDEEAQQLAPTIAFPSSTTVVQGTPVDLGFFVTGAPLPSLVLVAGTLPPGLELDGVTYRLHGTPTATGDFPGIEVRATNAAGSASVSFSLRVTEPPPAPVATDDVFNVTGHMAIDVPASGGVLRNDTPREGVLTGFGPDATDAARVAPGGSLTTGAGGQVTLGSDGAFSYLPAAGFSGTDAFAYTLANAGGSSMGTVTLTVDAHRVWFVDAAAGTGGTGTQAQPFADLSSVPATAFGDVIYVRSAETTYSPRILDAGVRLIGQGVPVDEVMLGFSPAVYTRHFPPSDTAPKLRTLVLANESRVWGVDLQPLPGERGLVGGAVAGVEVAKVSVRTTNAAAVELLSVSGTVFLRSVSASGGLSGVILRDNTGMFTVQGDGTQSRNASGGRISDTTGPAVVLDNARNVTLRSLEIAAVPQQACLLVEGVENLTVEGGNLGPCHEGIRIQGRLTGRIAISGTRLSGAGSAFTGALSSGVLDQLTFMANELQGSIMADGFYFVVRGQGRLTSALIRDNVFAGPGVDAGVYAVNFAVGQNFPSLPTAAPSARVTFTNNRITNVKGRAARFHAEGESGELRVSVRDNTFVSAGGAGIAPPMLMLSSGSNIQEASLLCADVRDNVASVSAGEAGFGLRRSSYPNAQLGLVGLPPGQTGAGVVNFVMAANPQGGAATLLGSDSGFNPCLLN